jgi:acyl-coenzyme A synthetase/AMP-(fatty) acid ligase
MQVVGEGRCPIVDTWWQTETGCAMITPLPYAWATKPGSATLPFFGVQPVLLTDKGEEIQGPGECYVTCHITRCNMLLVYVVPARLFRSAAILVQQDVTYQLVCSLQHSPTS